MPVAVVRNPKEKMCRGRDNLVINITYEVILDYSVKDIWKTEMEA